MPGSGFPGAAMPESPDEIRRQREYYERTAAEYDQWHVHDDDEHTLALAFASGIINWLGIHSVLDVGSGTGRAIHFLKRHCPGVKVVGLEPVAALREVGYSQGLSQLELIAGDATTIDAANESYDLVSEFGVLHHVREPSLAVAEMLRVARRAVFFSDSNNFGQGSPASRTIKRGLRATGLWPLANWIKTRGKGYSESHGDGVAYSYSVFDNHDQIARHCRHVHVLNTAGDGRCTYQRASHVALLGIK